MKKIIIICLTAMMFCNKIAAQQTNVDSLINVLKTHELENEDKLQLYHNIVSCYFNNDSDKTIAYAKDGLNLAEKVQHDSWASSFSNSMGVVYMFKNEYDSAIHCLKNAIDFSVKAKNKRVGNAAYVTLGTLYNKQGKYETALKYYVDVLPSLESEKQYESYANTLVNIGTIHQGLRDDKNALKYYGQAIKIAEEHNLARTMMGAYSGMGCVYADKQQHDSALFYALESLQISHSYNDKHYIIINTQVITGMYAALEDFDNAEKYLKECMETAGEYGDKQTIIMSWLIASNVYLNMRRFKDCEIYALKAWEADSTDSNNAVNASMALANAYAFLGNGDKANYFMGQNKNIRDRLNTKSLRESLAEMEVKYETEKKEMRIATLERERKLYAWIVIVSIIAALSSFGVLYFRRRLHRQQLKQLEQEKQLVASKAVIDGEASERSRLARDLHDGLSGMLSAVKLNLKHMKGFSLLDSADVAHFNTAIEMLDGSMGELRRIAHNLMPDALIKSGLQTALDDFCR
ncbi:MAG: tetratricopeptide repeat protein, partial [Prevotellaceae bacterium]|nr:tetratricopeptide repeat protein [Prevotellaceae bacterium]